MIPPFPWIPSIRIAAVAGVRASEPHPGRCRNVTESGNDRLESLTFPDRWPRSAQRPAMEGIHRSDHLETPLVVRNRRASLKRPSLASAPELQKNTFPAPISRTSRSANRPLRSVEIEIGNVHQPAGLLGQGLTDFRMDGHARACETAIPPRSDTGDRKHPT